MDVTYDDIARWLPRDIVDSIEMSLPCPRSANHQHLWDQEQVDVMAVYGPVRPYLWWWCVYCRATTTTRPVPPVDRPWAIIPAGEILAELR